MTAGSVFLLAQQDNSLMLHFPKFKEIARRVSQLLNHWTAISIKGWSFKPLCQTHGLGMFSCQQFTLTHCASFPWEYFNIKAQVSHPASTAELEQIIKDTVVILKRMTWRVTRNLCPTVQQRVLRDESDLSNITTKRQNTYKMLSNVLYLNRK